MTSPMPAYVWLRPNTPMFQAIFAPVLSATSKLERTCNIKFYRLGGDGFGIALDNFHQAPAFELRQGTGFLNAHGIADFRLGFFIVRIKFLVGRDDLLE